MPTPNRQLIKHAISIRTRNESAVYAPVDEPLAMRIADAYDEASHHPQDPTVRQAYREFIAETIEQFVILKQDQYVLEPWVGDGQPYANSKSMRQDVKRNRHLYIFVGGSLPGDHPMARISPFDSRGIHLTHNDVFRGVHDIYGHAMMGFDFGPRGEENAWRAHFQTYGSDLARAAMTTETRGQNSWVNFGRHLRRDDDSIPMKGDADFLSPTLRPYAEQKAVILPGWCWSLPVVQRPPSEDA